MPDDDYSQSAAQHQQGRALASQAANRKHKVEAEAQLRRL